MTHTHTKTYTTVTFANPYLVCTSCGTRAVKYRKDTWANLPCGHNAEVRSTCPTWSPVGGCACPTTCEIPS